MKKILKYLPILIISLLALSLSIYYLIFIYQITFEYAKDYLMQQANSVDKSLNKWYDERNADIRFVLQSKELRNFLFPPNDKARLANEKVLKEIVAPIAKSHKYQNFWILDQNAQTLFSLNTGYEVPQKLIDGRDLRVLVKSTSKKTVQSFVEVALPDETKATLLLVVNKIFQNNDSTKFFSFISSFHLDDILLDFIPSIWSDYELVEYTFSYLSNDMLFLIWNYPKKLNSIVQLPPDNDYIPYASFNSKPNFFKGKSLLNDFKTVGVGIKRERTNLGLSIQVFESKILTQINILMLIIGAAGVFFILAMILGFKSLKESERRKRLSIERDYLKKLYKETEKYELFTRGANDLIILCDENNNILEVNNKTIQVLRFSEDELKSKTLYEIVHPEDFDKIIGHEPDHEENLEIRLLDASSKEIYCSLSQNKIEYDGNNFFFYIIKDVTQLVIQIRKVSRLNRLLVMSRMINETVIRKFELGEIFARTCEIFVLVGGFKSSIFLKYIKQLDEFVVFSKFGIDLTGIIGEEEGKNSLEEKFTILKDCVQKKSTVFIRNLKECKKTTSEMLKLLEMELNTIVAIPTFHQEELFGVFLLLSKKGEVVDDEEDLMILDEIQSDITFAINDYLKDVKLAEARFKGKLFFDKSPNGFVIVDSTGKIDSANNFFIKLFGEDSEMVLNKSLFDLLPHHKEEISKLLNALIFEGIEKIEITVNTLEGLRWFLVVGEFIEMYNFYLLVFSDITEQKNYQFQLERQKERAEELEKLKSNILLNISHEFRTPLNGILGFSKLLESLNEDPEIKAFANLIYESGYRLYKTLESLIYTSQIVSGVLKPRKENIDLHSFFNDLIQDINFLIMDKNLKLILQVDCENCDVLTDRELLSSIMYSLIHNAVKFTPEGEVHIKVKTLQENGRNRFLIEVKDTGIGINPDFAVNIFELFRQGSEGLSRQYEGLGIGLFNAKKLVELLDGSLYFESEVGKGTTFFVKI